jgi:hypothetical protein
MGNTAEFWHCQSLDSVCGHLPDTNHVFRRKPTFIEVLARVLSLHIADYDGKDEHWLPARRE